MKRAKGVDKQLLFNYVRQAGTLNKVQEEREMWRLRSLEVQPRSWRTDRGQPLTKGRLVSDTLSPPPSPPPTSSPHPHPPSSSSSRFHWTRVLMKEEEKDPFRWGHGGYKEQYPGEFQSSGEEEDKKRAKKETKRKKRKKKEKALKRKQKRRPEKSPSPRDRAAVKRRRDASSERSSSEDNPSDGRSKVRATDSRRH